MKINYKDILYLILANCFIAIATVYFVIPHKLVSGGVSGLALILAYFIPLKINNLILICQLSLFIIGLICLGRLFALKALGSTLLYPFFVYLLSYFYFPLEISDLLAGIYCGILFGLGIGLAIRANGSTGGMDIPPIIISKYYNIDVAKIIIVTDGSLILFSAFTYGINKALIGLLVVFITSIVIDKTLNIGTYKTKKIEIISDQIDAINNEILNNMERGSSIIELKGGYTKEHRKMLICVVYNSQYQKIIDIINKYDSKAFVIITEAYHIHGSGFSYKH